MVGPTEVLPLKSLLLAWERLNLCSRLSGDRESSFITHMFSPCCWLRGCREGMGVAPSLQFLAGWCRGNEPSPCTPGSLPFASWLDGGGEQKKEPAVIFLVAQQLHDLHPDQPPPSLPAQGSSPVTLEKQTPGSHSLS
ncbi:hypothetical protein KIL84_019378 [Mauremys mutica]|uniref:Uncharacterized protein n=1 Tax=Mauremys mutica TaxID=74926 RepID=A0A9D4BB68_9SAUR|nr:hypothetical protein KIL84_019378 [Mauremys mutica]